MPTSTSTSIATAILTGSILISYALWAIHSSSPLTLKRKQRIRAKLPANLYVWRTPGSEKAGEQIWKALDKVFRESGFTLWPHEGFNVQNMPGGTNPPVTGFGYVISGRIPKQ
ncbi:hypothetical protein BDZ97DRAFT_1855251 [Flammula alnicola]|nr:hypothetical protein BDZ97DRAFT_1855251 [Flammula alnicola]